MIELGCRGASPYDVRITIPILSPMATSALTKSARPRPAASANRCTCPPRRMVRGDDAVRASSTRSRASYVCSNPRRGPGHSTFSRFLTANLASTCSPPHPDADYWFFARSPEHGAAALPPFRGATLLTPRDFRYVVRALNSPPPPGGVRCRLVASAFARNRLRAFPILNRRLQKISFGAWTSTSASGLGASPAQLRGRNNPVSTFYAKTAARRLTES